MLRLRKISYGYEMKLFLSYIHDTNAPLIEKIKEHLSKDAEGNRKHEVWIDTSEIKSGDDWRKKDFKRLSIGQNVWDE